mmetsp:Transcript_2261/g.6902  ORF Transcript_2261/g.6902 Transcript_2261/m.6902 type:complete len:236 (+) Transcript_2261:366-1073(+)
MPRSATSTVASFWKRVTRAWRSLAGVAPSIRMCGMSRRQPPSRASRTARWWAKMRILPPWRPSPPPRSVRMCRSIEGSLAWPERRKSSMSRAFLCAAISLQQARRGASSSPGGGAGFFFFFITVVDSTRAPSLLARRFLCCCLAVLSSALLKRSASSEARWRNSSRSALSWAARAGSSMAIRRRSLRLRGSWVRMAALLRRSMSVARRRVWSSSRCEAAVYLPAAASSSALEPEQ